MRKPHLQNWVHLVPLVILLFSGCQGRGISSAGGANLIKSQENRIAFKDGYVVITKSNIEDAQKKNLEFILDVVFTHSLITDQNTFLGYFNFAPENDWFIWTQTDTVRCIFNHRENLGGLSDRVTLFQSYPTVSLSAPIGINISYPSFDKPGTIERANLPFNHPDLN